MNKTTVLTLVLNLMVIAGYSSVAHAKGYEVCKGRARGGIGVTVTGNYSNQPTIEINANGQRLVYNASPDDSGDVEEAYSSADHGGLRITFYDEDNSASGWTQELGAFKLKCVNRE